MENVLFFTALSNTDLAKNFETAKAANQAAAARGDWLFTGIFIFVVFVAIAAILTAAISAFVGLKEAKNKRLAETVKAEGVVKAAEVQALATLMKAKADLAAFDERNKDMIQNDAIRSIMSKLTPEQKVELSKEVQTASRSNGKEALEKFNLELSSDEQLNSMIDELMSSTGFDEKGNSIEE